METPITARSQFAGRRLFFTADRWVWGFVGLVLLVTSLPYLLGFSVQGDAYRFSGFVFGVEDGNSYLAKMLSGTYGAWLFRSPYTADPQNGMFVYLPYLVLGKLAAPPGLHDQLAALFHLYRLAGGLLAILATYDFLAFFLVDIRLRRFGLALVMLGGGVGWLMLLIGQQTWLGSMPLEFYSPETFGFLGIFGLPHLALARALMLWALLHYLSTMQQPQTVRPSGDVLRSAAKLAGLWLLAGIVQPLAALLIGVVLCWHLAGLGARQALRGRRGLPADAGHWRQSFGLVVMAGVIPGIFVLYNAAVTWWDPYVRAWTAQNLILSPRVGHYVLAYGLLVPYAWAGGRRLLRTDPWAGWLLAGWVLLLPVLAYAPLGLQRRLPDGMWVAWVALALAGLPGKLASNDGPSARRRYRLAQAPLWLLFPGTLILFLGSLLAARSLQPPLFLPADEVKTFEYLQINSVPGSVALTSFVTGNAFPAWAPVRVLIGHGPESANLAGLTPQADAFYQAGTPDGQRLAFISRFNIHYIFWGPAEKALGTWDPAQAGFLQLATQNGDYALFEVTP